MTLQYLHLCDLKHCLIPPYVLLIPQIGILWKSVDATGSQLPRAERRSPLASFIDLIPTPRTTHFKVRTVGVCSSELLAGAFLFGAAKPHKTRDFKPI